MYGGAEPAPDTPRPGGGGGGLAHPGGGGGGGGALAPPPPYPGIKPHDTAEVEQSFINRALGRDMSGYTIFHQRHSLLCNRHHSVDPKDLIRRYGEALGDMLNNYFTGRRNWNWNGRAELTGITDLKLQDDAEHPALKAVAAWSRENPYWVQDSPLEFEDELMGHISKKLGEHPEFLRHFGAYKGSKGRCMICMKHLTKYATAAHHCRYCGWKVCSGCLVKGGTNSSSVVQRDVAEDPATAAAVGKVDCWISSKQHQLKSCNVVGEGVSYTTRYQNPLNPGDTTQVAIEDQRDGTIETLQGVQMKPVCRICATSAVLEVQNRQKGFLRLNVTRETVDGGGLDRNKLFTTVAPSRQRAPEKWGDRMKPTGDTFFDDLRAESLREDPQVADARREAARRAAELSADARRAEGVYDDALGAEKQSVAARIAAGKKIVDDMRSAGKLTAHIEREPTIPEDADVYESAEQGLIAEWAGTRFSSLSQRCTSLPGIEYGNRGVEVTLQLGPVEADHCVNVRRLKGRVREILSGSDLQGAKEEVESLVADEEREYATKQLVYLIDNKADGGKQSDLQARLDGDTRVDEEFKSKSGQKSEFKVCDACKEIQVLYSAALDEDAHGKMDTRKETPLGVPPGSETIFLCTRDEVKAMNEWIAAVEVNWDTHICSNLDTNSTVSTQAFMEIYRIWVPLVGVEGEGDGDGLIYGDHPINVGGSAARRDTLVSRARYSDPREDIVRPRPPDAVSRPVLGHRGLPRSLASTNKLRLWSISVEEQELHELFYYVEGLFNMILKSKGSGPNMPTWTEVPDQLCQLTRALIEVIKTALQTQGDVVRTRPIPISKPNVTHLHNYKIGDMYDGKIGDIPQLKDLVEVAGLNMEDKDLHTKRGASWRELELQQRKGKTDRSAEAIHTLFTTPFDDGPLKVMMTPLMSVVSVNNVVNQRAKAIASSTPATSATSATKSEFEIMMELVKKSGAGAGAGAGAANPTYIMDVLNFTDINGYSPLGYVNVVIETIQGNAEHAGLLGVYETIRGQLEAFNDQTTAIPIRVMDLRGDKAACITEITQALPVAPAAVEAE